MDIAPRRIIAIALSLAFHQAYAVKIEFKGAYVPSIRHITEDTLSDYFDGFGYGVAVSFRRGKANEVYLSYLFTHQVANYSDIATPTESTDQIIGLGWKRYLANSRRGFLLFEGTSVLSNTFESPKFGGAVGGGFTWMMGESLSIGISTLFGVILYTGMHRRYLRQSIDLGLTF